MFDIKKDRLNYGDILKPPKGYSLLSAIGTTYSLDMHALTAIAISLGLDQETDSQLMDNPVCQLNALQRISEKVLIFCEAGQIKYPNNTNPLFLLLEKMIQPVVLENGGAFHAKSWVATYENKNGDRVYRFVVMSRNLTFDRSWDVTFAMQGEKVDVPYKGNENQTEPLIGFLKFLRDTLNPNLTAYQEKYSLLENTITDLAKVEFSLKDEYTKYPDFACFRICPIGLDKKRYPLKYQMEDDYLFKKPFGELVVISPFLSDGLVKQWNQPSSGKENAKRTLITRKAALDKIDPVHANNFDTYVLKDTIYDGEECLADVPAENIQKQDIHAKMFLWTNGSQRNLYLGSMNATHNAVCKNVEMMIRLWNWRTTPTTNSLLKDIFGTTEFDSPENPFELATWEKATDAETEDEARALENSIKMLCRADFSAEILHQDELYQIVVHIPENAIDDRLSLSPLRVSKSCRLESDIVYEHMGVLELSEFYRVTATGQTRTIERVIMIPTANLPKNRDEKVFQNVIKDERSFINYIALVLGDDALSAMLEASNVMHGKADGNAHGPSMTGLYEKMLKIAAEQPARLRDVDELLIKLDPDSNIIPAEFTQVMQVFRQILIG